VIIRQSYTIRSTRYRKSITMLLQARRRQADLRAWPATPPPSRPAAAAPSPGGSRVNAAELRRAGFAIPLENQLLSDGQFAQDVGRYNKVRCLARETRPWPRSPTSRAGLRFLAVLGQRHPYRSYEVEVALFIGRRNPRTAFRYPGYTNV
jgi:hypothetical protein